MTVTVDMGPYGAIWGSGSNQRTQEMGKVHKGSCGVEVRSDGCLMDDNEDLHGARWGQMGPYGVGEVIK